MDPRTDWLLVLVAGCVLAVIVVNLIVRQHRPSHDSGDGAAVSADGNGGRGGD